MARLTRWVLAHRRTTLAFWSLILLDATVVRALLVPALVSLFGSWNWWLPTPIARVLRTEPSPVPIPAHEG